MKQSHLFFRMLSGTLGSIVLKNLLTVKGVKAKIPRQVVIRTRKGTIRAGQYF